MGIYNVWIVLVLNWGPPWYDEIDYYYHPITILNRPPTFTSPLSPSSFTIPYNTTQSLTLPSYNDPDGHTVIIQTTSLPAFVTFDSIHKIFTFKPTTLSDFGTYTLTITLTDTSDQTDYTITLNVINNPPVYNTPVPSTPIYS